MDCVWIKRTGDIDTSPALGAVSAAAGATVDKIVGIPAKQRFQRAKFEENIDDELAAVDKEFDEQFKALGA